MFEVELKGKTSAGVVTTVQTDADGVVSVSGARTTSTTTTVVSGSTPSDTADDGDNPVKIGGIARTTNPTAVTDGDRVSATFDDLGRLINYPFQVRDLIFTASASLSTGTETTLFAGSAGVFHDLLELTMSNNSGVAQVVSIRSETGAGVVRTLTAEANKTISMHFPIPVIQNTAAAAWTVDMDDVTGTTITVDALFIRNP